MTIQWLTASTKPLYALQTWSITGLFYWLAMDCVGVLLSKLATQCATLQCTNMNTENAKQQIYITPTAPRGRSYLSANWNHKSGNTEIFIIIFSGCNDAHHHIFFVKAGDWHNNQMYNSNWSGNSIKCDSIMRKAVCAVIFSIKSLSFANGFPYIIMSTIIWLLPKYK